MKNRLFLAFSAILADIQITNSPVRKCAREHICPSGKQAEKLSYWIGCHSLTAVQHTRLFGKLSVRNNDVKNHSDLNICTPIFLLTFSAIQVILLL